MSKTLALTEELIALSSVTPDDKAAVREFFTDPKWSRTVSECE